MLRNNTFRSLFVALLVILAGCVKPATILRNGVEIPIEEAAKLDYAQGERFFQRKEYKAATTKFQGIVAELHATSYADNAMLRLAQIYRIRKQNKNAISMLETILARYPQSDVFDTTKEELAVLLSAEKDFKRAGELFASINWKNIAPERRAQLEKPARDAFAESHQPFLKLSWLLSIYDLDPVPDRRKEILETLDQVSVPDDLARLIADRGDRFPADYALFRSAKLNAHMGNVDAARKSITSFQNRFPRHELSQDAMELSEKLYRSAAVHPKALGLLVPLTGTNDNLAEPVLKGAALAMNLFTNAPILGDPMRLYIEDSGETPEQAVAALDNLVRKHNVIAVAGPLYARQSQAAAIAAAEVGLPIISMSAAEGVTQIGPTVFRNSITKSEQAANLAYLAHDILGIRRCAILYPSNNYGTEFMKFFWDEFVSRGGEIRAIEVYDGNSKDVTTSVKKMVGLSPLSLREKEICSKADSKIWKEKSCYPVDKLPPIVDFEAIFIPDNYDMAGQLASMLAYYDIRGVQILGTNLWNTPDLLQGEEETKHLQGALFLDGFWKEKKMPPTPQFVERFYSTMGHEPGIFEAFGFDTVNLMLQTVEKENPSSRSDFAAALSRVKDYPGVTGSISFKQNRDAVRRLTILTVDGSRITELE